MQSKHTGILRAINNTSKKYNILTYTTHDPHTVNLAQTGHNFFLLQMKGLRSWSHNFRKLPSNVVLLGDNENFVRPDMQFDMILSQTKWGQFQHAFSIAERFNLPLISLEHTLPMPNWNSKIRKQMVEMSGNVNIFISKHSIKEWQFNKEDPSVEVIEHGIQTDIFKPTDAFKDRRIMTCANDYINRSHLLGFEIYREITKGLPTNPIGETQGFSKPAKDLDDLLYNYQRAGVFLNTSLISPIPMSLLEAAACGCPIVTTSTCLIPDIFEDGKNAFVSNDNNYLRDRLIWCLDHPQEASETIGKKARQTILDRFNIERHSKDWNNIFDKCYGKGRYWN